MYMYTYVISFMYICIVLNPNLRFHNRIIYKKQNKKNLAPSLER